MLTLFDSFGGVAEQNARHRRDLIAELLLDIDKENFNRRGVRFFSVHLLPKLDQDVLVCQKGLKVVGGS